MVSSAVFKINTSEGSGSGFYIKSKGIIVTNCHVVKGFKEVCVEDQQKNRFLAKVIMINSEVDVAFLKPEKEFDIDEVSIADIAELRSRDNVLVLGFPYGLPYTETQGIVSNPKQLMGDRYYIQTDAAVNPGNSGGPVVNARGQIIGITTCKFTEADNMGFAVPSDVLLDELNSLAQNPEAKYAVKCNSCKSLIFNQTEYCQSCGNTIDQKLFEEIQPTNVERFVEETIKEFGVNPILARAGYEFWEFHQGSALIRIFVYNKDYLYATSPLNNLPTSNLDKLYKYILSNPVSPYQLGVHSNQIFVSYRVHMSDVFSEHATKVRTELKNILQKADDLDDFFETEYACPKSNFAKAV